MPNRFRVHVLLPPVKGPDVSKRRLVRSMNAGPTAPFDIPNEWVETTFKATQGDKVHLEFSQVDDVGNVSESAVMDFEIIDTTAPQTPDGFTITMEEIEDDSPAPNPDTELPDGDVVIDHGPESPTEPTPEDPTP